MQDRQRMDEGNQKNYVPAFSPGERYRIAQSKIPWQTARENFLSPDELEQLILTLPTHYREVAIHTVATYFLTIIQLHILQLIAKFSYKASAEGISLEERDGTLQDIEVDVQEIMNLDQWLTIDSVDKLFQLGTIIVNVMNLSHSDTAEEAQSSLYAIPGLLHGWFERTHLFRGDQPE